MRNCPNCGAPVHGAVCEYCGTVQTSPELAAEIKLSEKIIRRMIEEDYWRKAAAVSMRMLCRIPEDWSSSL